MIKCITRTTLVRHFQVRLRSEQFGIWKLYYKVYQTFLSRGNRQRGDEGAIRDLDVRAAAARLGRISDRGCAGSAKESITTSTLPGAPTISRKFPAKYAGGNVCMYPQNWRCGVMRCSINIRQRQPNLPLALNGCVLRKTSIAISTDWNIDDEEVPSIMVLIRNRYGCTRRNIPLHLSSRHQRHQPFMHVPDCHLQAAMLTLLYCQHCAFTKLGVICAPAGLMPTPCRSTIGAAIVDGSLGARHEARTPLPLAGGSVKRDRRVLAPLPPGGGWFSSGRWFFFHRGYSMTRRRSSGATLSRHRRGTVPLPWALRNCRINFPPFRHQSASASGVSAPASPLRYRAEKTSRRRPSCLLV